MSKQEITVVLNNKEIKFTLNELALLTFAGKCFEIPREKRDLEYCESCSLEGRCDDIKEAARWLSQKPSNKAKFELTKKEEVKE